MENNFRTEPVSFIRRGSRLNPKLQKIWDTQRHQYLIELPRQAAATSISSEYKLDINNIYSKKNPLIVEIGSGMGENILQAAKNNPNINFLAIEVYTPGIAQTILKATKQELHNIKIILGNAPEVLDSFPPASIQELWIFFPDPWPKTRHHKRRLINQKFINTHTDSKILKTGILRLATDWEDYAKQILELDKKIPNFINPHKKWAPRFEKRPITNFEQKAINSKREIFDITYQKI